MYINPSEKHQFGKGSTPIILVVLALAAGGVAYYGMNVPGDQAAGTIAPAERMIGEQIAAEDVQLGDQSVAEDSPGLAQTR